MQVDEKAVFFAALELGDARERERYLQAACGSEPEMLGRVRELILAHEGTVGPLDRRPDALGATVDGAPGEGPLSEGPGAVIGPYRLMEEIGAGGFGLVFVAEQQRPVRRKVALKIIKPGMDTREVIARFEAERQALALMDHPNIARVFDGGATPSGRPYFVMELVKGVPITEFCDRHRLPVGERVKLFVDVCQALQHAHQKGVIHRDLKPANILVSLHDATPVVKVIDFGVAKAIGQRLTEKTVYTGFTRMIGTPVYMSPEQAGMSDLDIDTRSDVYSLGVLLYELLTGTTPFDKDRLRTAAFEEIRRIIREEDPPRPSARFTALGQAASVVSANRKCGASDLLHVFRGELDWVVMKCLEKDRTRRYETVNALARDVQRYLNCEPVEACPPSALYRLGKLARRHRALLTTAACIVGILLIASVVSTVLAAWALRSQHELHQALDSERRAHDEAVDARERADQAAQRLRDATQITNDGIEYYARRNWWAAHQNFTRAMQIEPSLNTPYIYRGSLYASLGVWDKAAADYDRRLQLASRANADTWFDYLLLKSFNGDQAGYRQACQEMLRQHGNSADVRSRYCVLRSCLLTTVPFGEPAELVRRAEALANEASAPWHVGLAGRAHLLAGDFPAAEARLQEAIQLGAGAPNGIQRVNYVDLAQALQGQGKHAAAEQALAVADGAKEQWTRTMQAALVGTMPLNWCDWLDFLYRHRQASIVVRGAPPAEDPRLAAVYDRAVAALAQGDVYTQMDAGRQHVHHQEWDQAASAFASVLDTLPADFRGASNEMRFCVEMVQRPEVFDRLVELRPNNRLVWWARGRVRAASGDWANAAADYQKTLDLLEPTLRQGDAEPWRWISWAATNLELSALLLLKNDSDGYRKSSRAAADAAASDNSIVLSCLSRSCTLSPAAEPDFAAGLTMAQGAVRLRPRLAWNLYALGIAQYRAGRPEDAIAVLKRSLAADESWVGRGQTYVVMALACHSLQRDKEARQWLEQAGTWLNETNRNAATWTFGYAASDFLGDWLCAQVLLREARAVLQTSRD